MEANFVDEVIKPERIDVEAIAGEITRRDDSWQAGVPQRVGSFTWQPDLQRDNPPAVLHVHLVKELRSYLLDRLRAAHQAGNEIHVAMPLSQLYDEALLEALVGLEPAIHLIVDVYERSVNEPLDLLGCLANNRVKVSPSARTRIAEVVLELSRSNNTAQKRGRSFEALLVFLLSQVNDFEVVERNLRISAEELDAVIQQRATGGRVWATLNTPFILLEAKNWRKEDKVDQKELSAFRVKIQGKRGTVRIGLLVSASGFTSDATKQEIRFASDDLTIVMLGPEQLREWIAAEDADTYLEGLVRRAMLR